MGHRRATYLRWAAAGSATAVLLTMAAWVWSAYSLGGLKDVLAVAGSMAALLGPLFAWALHRRQHNAPDRAPEEQVHEDLLHRYLADEADRRLQDPLPLPVRWANTHRPVADHWEVVRRSPDAAGPLDLSGALDDPVRDVPEVFARIPSRRLVLLGEAGAGKTVLVTRLARRLLERWQPGRPIPVVVSLRSWNPVRTGFREWLAEQLSRDYPYLRVQAETAPTLARRLVDAHRIMPLLDGLDELAPSLRTTAINELNSSLTDGEPLVLTSRPKEYETALTNRVLTGAAVVELQPLSSAEIRDYLRLSTRRQHTDIWRPVFNRLADQPHGQLAQALSSPLMVTLVRTTYSDADATPSELVDDRRFAAREQIENHLLDAFLRTAYGRSLPHRAPERLRFLARHLSRLHTQELAWWELHRAVPRRVLRGMTVVTAAFLGMVSLGTLFGPGFGIVGLIMGGACTSRTTPPPPAAVQWRSTERHTPLHRRFSVGVLTIGLGPAGVLGTLALLGGWAAGEPGAGLLLAATSAGAIAVAGGLSGLALLWLWDVPPLVGAEQPSPGAVLRRDRAYALGTSLIAGIIYGSVLAVTMGALVASDQGTRAGVRVALAVLAGCFLMTAEISLVSSAWGQFVFTRAWLALRRRLPFNVLRFLDDARDHGVLRQSGGVHLFRHGLLQERLAGEETARAVPA
ncbi:NACHT domain-containing protein [Streptomyces sp. NPDC042319]|uniref:NACHT domain-containing protein n=1 Tax=Streptomyces sp. NPDC042319 TaxID=3154332 RepID=UPI003402E7EC